MYIKPELTIYDANLLRKINANASSISMCTAPNSGCVTVNSGINVCACSTSNNCKCGTSKSTCHGKESKPKS